MLYVRLDIVKSSSRKSCCFTKAYVHHVLYLLYESRFLMPHSYGHYVEGTGSVLQMAQLDVRKLHFIQVATVQTCLVDAHCVCPIRYAAR